MVYRMVRSHWNCDLLFYQSSLVLFHDLNFWLVRHNADCIFLGKWRLWYCWLFDYSQHISTCILPCTAVGTTILLFGQILLAPCSVYSPDMKLDDSGIFAVIIHHSGWLYMCVLFWQWSENQATGYASQHYPVPVPKQGKWTRLFTRMVD